MEVRHSIYAFTFSFFFLSFVSCTKPQSDSVSSQSPGSTSPKEIIEGLEVGPDANFLSLNYEAQPLSFKLSAIPLEGESTATLQYSILESPQHGSVSLQLPNITYTPQSDFAGIDSLKFKVRDSKGRTGEGIVNISVPRVTKILKSGGELTCALSQDGMVKCFGKNDNGQLGLGNTLSYGDDISELGDALPLVQFGTDVKATDLALGNSHTCILLESGKAKCFGKNDSGQLGNGTNTDVGKLPTEMGDGLSSISLGFGKKIVQMALGASHSCFLGSDNTVYCTGLNDYGQLGIGNTVNQNTLVKVLLPSTKTVQSIAAGDYHNCALFNDGSVSCWGNNLSGQLGYEDKVSRGISADQMGDNLPVVNLGSGLIALQISLAGGRSCARTSSGVKCWGANYEGELGYGDTILRGDSGGTMGDSLAFVPFGSGGVPDKLALGSSHACALFSNSTVNCWGLNSSGQLGAGDTVNRSLDKSNINLSSDSSVDTITLGSHHSCVRYANGQVKCWGKNQNGQAGVGSKSNIHTANKASSIW